MRLLYTLIFFAFIYSSCKNSPATVKLEDGSEVRKALANEWQSAFIETVGSRIKMPEAQVSNIFFNSDGTYSSKLKDGVIETKGNWSYNPKTKMISTGVGNLDNLGRIMKLTGNELILAQYTTFDDKIVDSLIITFRKL